MTRDTVATNEVQREGGGPRSVLPLFSKELRDSRIGLLGWTLGHVGAILLYLPFYPSFGSNQDMQSFFTDFPPQVVTLFGLDQLYSGPAYTQATYFGLTAFLLLAIAVVSWGAAAIAGDEESGGLELTLAHGVTRSQVVLERALALLLRVVVVTGFAGLAIWSINDYAELSIAGSDLVAVTAALVGLAVLVGMAALSAGAATGRRSVATAVGAGVGVLAYVLDAVSKTAGLPWLARVSPFSWAYGASPITEGVDWPGLALLFGVSLVLLLIAVALFRRRDVGA